MTQTPFLSSSQSRPAHSVAVASVRNLPVPQQTLANRLAERLGLQQGSLNRPAENFAPARVAETVLGFIEGRLQQARADGADTTQLEKLYDQARKGVEQGFAEARKILDGMGVLKGKVAEDIDDTYNRIQSGMSDIAQRLLPGRDQVSVANYSSLVALSESFELSVTTREGDRLRISIAQASVSAATVEKTADGFAGSAGMLQVGQFQVAIEGQLNNDERAALESLLGQVQELASRFYAGDLTGAFDRALALDLDGTQLASMSLSLTQTSVRQVSEAYRSVAGQAAPVSAVNNQLRDYAEGLLQALRSASEVSSDGLSFLEQLLRGGFALDERFDQGRLDKAETINNRLLQGLAQQLAAE